MIQPLELPPWISNKGSEGSSRCTVNKNSIFIEIKGHLNWKKACPAYDDLQVLVHCDLWLEFGIYCTTITGQCHSLSFGWKLTFFLFSGCFPRCVIEKTADGQIVFKLTISEKETMFYYRTVNGLQPPIKVMTLGRILVKKWIHLSVQVSKIKNI